MRSVMISLTILLFCFSMELVNTVNDDFVDDKGLPLYGWRSEPYIQINDMPDKLTDDTAFNSSLIEETKPSQNFLESGVNVVTSAVDAFKTSLDYLMSGVQFIANVLIKSTIGFDDFIKYMGKTPQSGCATSGDRCPVQWIPTDVAFLIKVLINMNHLLALFQILSKTDLRGGA